MEYQKEISGYLSVVFAYGADYEASTASRWPPMKW
jgi:hypothetical protein